MIEKDENEIDGCVEVTCHCCGVNVWLSPEDPEVEADPYFCEDPTCVSAAFRYHVGGPY